MKRDETLPIALPGGGGTAVVGATADVNAETGALCWTAEKKEPNKLIKDPLFGGN
jgi:hypothetical protein